MEVKWSSLEIVKITISALTPIIVALLGFKITKMFKKYDKAQWTNQKVLEKRLQIYDEVVFMLNDILCFHCYIGNWKELSPIKIIEHKRQLDKKLNVYAPLFTEDLIVNYNAFIHECFELFTGWGNDAKIKSSYKRRIEFNAEWSDDWNNLFSSEYLNNSSDEKTCIKQKQIQYSNLMDVFKTNLDFFKTGSFNHSNTPDINF